MSIYRPFSICLKYESSSAFNQEKALIGAFSVILKSPRTFVWSSNSLSPVSPVPAMRLEGDMAGGAQGAGHEAATLDTG